MKISEHDALFDPLNRMLDFSGRSTRAQFWPFLAIYIVATALIPLLGAPLPDPGMVSNPERIDMSDVLSDYVLRQGLVFAVFVIPLMSVTTRRLHDAGWSGRCAAPLLLLHFVVFLLQAKVLADGVQTGTPLNSPFFSLLGAITTIYKLVTIGIALLCLLPSDPDANRFGAPQFS